MTSDSKALRTILTRDLPKKDSKAFVKFLNKFGKNTRVKSSTRKLAHNSG